MNLLSNVHLGLSDPAITSNSRKKTHLITNDYQYYHYKCDGFDDVVRHHHYSVGVNS